MMCLIAKHKLKSSKSTRLKNRLFSFDKYDPANLQLPDFIENIDDKELYNIIINIVSKYQEQNYTTLEREELDKIDIFSDYEVLVLLKFYKHNNCIKVENSHKFFPTFAFTYNIEPLKKQIDKIVGIAYDKIDSEITKEELFTNQCFSALDVTYLLHYFIITHPQYIEE